MERIEPATQAMITVAQRGTTTVTTPIRPAWLTGTTVRYPPETEEEVGPASAPGANAPADAVAASDPAGELLAMEPGRCPPIDELWVADGRPVEDPCTLAEVRRATYLAYTGTDEQRRSAIRNGPLLDEVFAALDDFGRNYGAVLYHPEQRGRSSVIFEEIVWRGAPGRGPGGDSGPLPARPSRLPRHRSGPGHPRPGGRGMEGLVQEVLLREGAGDHGARRKRCPLSP